MPRSPCSASTLFRTTLVEPVLVRVAEILCADVAGFADADDDDLCRAGASVSTINSTACVECAVELRAHCFERGQFDVEHSPGLGQMIHAARLP